MSSFSEPRDSFDPFEIGALSGAESDLLTYTDEKDRERQSMSKANK